MAISLLRPFQRLGIKKGLMIYLTPLFGGGFLYSIIFENKSDFWSTGRIMSAVFSGLLLVASFWIIKYFITIRPDDDKKEEVANRRPRRNMPVSKSSEPKPD